MKAIFYTLILIVASLTVGLLSATVFGHEFVPINSLVLGTVIAFCIHVANHDKK